VLVTRADRTLLAGVLALAALLRLPALGAEPLGAGEAAHAFRALRLASAGDASVEGLTSPFAAGAQALVFAFLGAGDARARVPAAACGLALVLVPALAWPLLGRRRTLAVCVLLACDPLQVRASRLATGEAATALGGALVAVCLLRWREAARRSAAEGRRMALATAAAAGFLVATGPAAWALLPPLALAACLLRPWSLADVPWGRLLGLAAAVALVCASAGLLAVPWASAVSASLTAALAGDGVPPALAAPSLGVLIAVTSLCGGARPRMLAVAAAIAFAALVAAPVVAVPVPGRPAPSLRDRDLRALASDAREIAIERGHAAGEMPVLLVADRLDPEIAWALRDLRRLEWAAVRPTGGMPGSLPLLVAPAGTAGAPEGHLRRTYGAGPLAVTLWIPVTAPP
jgi:hypothetical protein